jgi:hypothetical protein
MDSLRSQPSVTFEDLDDALRAIRRARPAAYVIGLLNGCVSAPRLVTPSQFLAEIFDGRIKFPDPESAERVLSLIMAMNNQLASMVMDGRPLDFRRTKTPMERAEMLLWSRDLLNEINGFQEGLFLGVEHKGDLPTKCSTHIGQLVLERKYLGTIERSLANKRTLYDDARLQSRYAELAIRSDSCTNAMHAIAQILLKKRVRQSKP